ncbi:MAG: T9SS type A sorting domain-containing protein [Candidatus Krumholzibacteriota bacterium]|nr:T9SS type A sorting domain-containing protein [Candidatus Krumholzibacteriota bacterium]
MRKAIYLTVWCALVILLAMGTASGYECIKYVQCGSMAPTHIDTANHYFLAGYDFEAMDWQGWTRLDNTAQIDTFAHVDDFVGLGGGTYGHLVPLEGMQSWWCGVRPDTNDIYRCSWYSAPGYGNRWMQILQTDPFYQTGPVTITFKGCFNSEPDQDFTFLEYSTKEGEWQELDSYTGSICTGNPHTVTLPPSANVQTKLRFRFESDCSFSDQDGYDTDGAFIVDSLVISDNSGIIDYENCETALLGAHQTDGDFNGIHWFATVVEPFGMYSGLMANLIDNDPCTDNFSTQVVFFIGSTNPSAELPGLFDTPFCKGPGGLLAPCQDEMIVSPVIDMTKYSSSMDENQDATIPPGDLAGLTETMLEFTVYRDLPVLILSYYHWRVRNISESGCPGPWFDGGMIYYSPYKDYFTHQESISDLVAGGKIQIALGVVDMCGTMYELAGDCAAHTPAPFIDEVQLRRYGGKPGPKWRVKHAELFSDNFPSNPNDIESYVRADMAADMNSRENPDVRPGDSIIVWCGSPLGGGIAEDANGNPKVYMHVKAEYVGPGTSPWGPKPQYLVGPQLQGDYGYYISDDGVAWTTFGADSGCTCPPFPPGMCPDCVNTEPPLDCERHSGPYCFDLNDSLFTRGYLISYYFSAMDNNGDATTFGVYPVTFSGASSGKPHYVKIISNWNWTCLPSANSDILYVDACHMLDTGPGSVEDYFNPAFQAVLPPDNQPDVYNVMGANSCLRGVYPVTFSGASSGKPSIISTGLGSRSYLDQLLVYKKIIWDAGELKHNTIPTGRWTKRDDCKTLSDWMDAKKENAGLWILGDNVAEEISSTTHGQALLNRCGVICTNGSYYNLTGGSTAGGTISPLTVGTSGSIFNSPPPAADSFYVYGGPPLINGFDVLNPITGTSIAAMEYPDFMPGTKCYAAIQHQETNQHAKTIRTMWFGFSFKFIRDHRSMSPIARYRVLDEVIDWFENSTNVDITGTNEQTPRVYSLAQNFPNPFNPSTTIKYEMKKKGRVRIRVYDVTGKLVKTLVSAVRDAGPHTVNWDGENNAGHKVASGIYFYRMETEDFVKAKKMVLLR